MLRLLRRILGWDADSGPFDFDCLEQPVRPPSSTASVLKEKPKPVAQSAAQKEAAQKGATKAPREPAKQRPPKEADPAKAKNQPWVRTSHSDSQRRRFRKG